jgi:acyl dehydratase
VRDNTGTVRQVGNSTEPFKGIIERVKLIEYAKALHLRNPIHWDKTAAVNAGYSDVVAVPGFITTLTMQQRDVKFATFQLDERKTLLGELKWEHHGVVCAGDELQGKCTLISVSEKKGQRPMEVLVFETRLTNQMGKNVLTIFETHLERKD